MAPGMWFECWKMLACYIVFAYFQGTLSVELRTLMRRERRHPVQWQPHGVHVVANGVVNNVASPSQIAQPLVQGRGHNSSNLTLQRGELKNSMLANATRIDSSAVATPMASDRHVSLGHAVVTSAGDKSSFIPLATVTDIPGALFMRQSGAQDPTTTGAVAAATTAAAAAAAGATTAAPAAADATTAAAGADVAGADAVAPASEDTAASPAPAGGDSGGVSMIVVVVVIAVVAAGLAALLAKFFSSKRVVTSRSGGVKFQETESQFSTSSERIKSRRAKMTDGSDSNNDDTEGSGGGASNRANSASTYRDRRERNRRRSLSQGPSRSSDNLDVEDDTPPNGDSGESYSKRRARSAGRGPRRGGTGGMDTDDSEAPRRAR